MNSENLPPSVQRSLDDIQQQVAFAKLRGTDDIGVLHAAFIGATEAQAHRALSELVSVLRTAPAFVDATIVVAHHGDQPDAGADPGAAAAEINAAVDRAIGGVLYLPGAGRILARGDSNAAEIALRTRMEEDRGRFVLVVSDSVDGIEEMRQICPGLLMLIPTIWDFRG